MSHPVTLRLSDDLRRNRITVLFRPLLAIPLLVWLLAWGIAVVPIAVVNWFATLATGTPWKAAHRFASRYVRFAVHTLAYATLLAEPYPGFAGEPGYPVDVELPKPAPQRRWSVAFRIVLVLPALVLAIVFTAGVPDPRAVETAVDGGGILTLVAALGGFAALVQASMPRGLRDAGAYALLYATQTLAYLLLLTDLYPNSDPQVALDDLPVRDDAIQLDMQDDVRRSRATTLFRFLLAFVHWVWAGIWGVAVLAGAVANWFVQVVAGRPHEGIHRFTTTYLRYVTHVYAYSYLLADPFPEFDGRAGAYPVDLSVAGPRRQRRVTVAFRLVLAFPALLISGAYGGVALIGAVFGWFAILVRGEMPQGLRNLIALWLRYNQQMTGYVLLLTEQYPYSGPIATGPVAEPEPPVFLPPDALATV